MTRIAATLAKMRWQLFIAGGLYLACLLLFMGVPSGATSGLTVRITMLALGTVGTVLALVASVSFAFTTFQITQANSRKHDLFYRFKRALFDFDDFLTLCKTGSPIVSTAQELSWKLKSVKMEDFPLMDWEDWLSGLDQSFHERHGDAEEDPNLGNKILGHLVHLEELVSDIGVTCIHQVLLKVYVEIVQKAFAVLAALLVIVVLASLGFSGLPPALLAPTPVFFGALAALLLFEMGWRLRRESEEASSFVDSSGDEAEKSGAGHDC